ncbi:MAG: FecR domain-containing protein [Flavobacteriales bacterium]
MTPSSNIDSDLLARYVAGEATEAQCAVVEQWAAEAPEHARELAALQEVWSLSGVPNGEGDVDVAAAWERVNERTGGPLVIPIDRPARSVWRWVAAAAAVVALLLVGRVFLTSDAHQEFVADASYVPAVLADSSTVTLSPGSRLAAIMGDQRSVDLKGQAYFEVKRDEQRPFVVHTTDLDVTVLGTAFEVTAFDGNDTVLVRVRHGRVGVALRSDNANDTLVLSAGEEARWVRGERLLERAAIGPVERWADKIIQFTNAPMQRVVEELNDAYGARITLGNDAIAGCPLTASFGDEPIDEIVRVIANTFGFEVVGGQDKTYTLSGDGC